MKEPPRLSDTALLVPYVRERVERIICRLRERGFDPVVFEAVRTPERQKWLYGIGRTHSKGRRPVTWTMDSKHLAGKAVDIISKSRRWEHPAFFRALKQEARRERMHTLGCEQCHIEWRG